MAARAWGWGYQVITISLEMVVPSILGLGVDRWLHTLPLFLILGAIFGMIAGTIHLVQFASRINEESRTSSYGERRSEEGGRPRKE